MSCIDNTFRNSCVYMKESLVNFLGDKRLQKYFKIEFGNSSKNILLCF